MKEELKVLLESQQELLLGIFQTMAMIIQAQEKQDAAVAELIAMQIKFMAMYEIDRAKKISLSSN